MIWLGDSGDMMWYVSIIYIILAPVSTYRPPLQETGQTPHVRSVDAHHSTHLGHTGPLNFGCRLEQIWGVQRPDPAASDDSQHHLHNLDGTCVYE